MRLKETLKAIGFFNKQTLKNHFSNGRQMVLFAGFIISNPYYK